MVNTGEPQRFEKEYLRKDGSKIAVELLMHCNFDTEGNVASVYGFVTDITERKQAEEQLTAYRDHLEEMVAARTRELDTANMVLRQTAETLAESEQRFHSLVDNIRLGVARSTPGPRARFIEVNPAMEKITGYSREELLDMNPTDFYANPEDRAGMIDELVSERGQMTTDRWKRRKDGTPILTRALYTEVKDESGRLVYIDGVHEDITERHYMEEEKERLEHEAHLAHRLAAIGEIAAGVAHELNNPLGGILGFCELLLEGELPEEARRDVEVIRGESERAAQIVRQLLTYARGHDPSRQNVDVNDVIETVLRLRSYELETNNIQVKVELDADAPTATGDAGQLQQVFLNLIVNAEFALKVVRRKRRMTISSEVREDIIRITVKDNGPGIDEADLGKIFDPFFSTKDFVGGTGLGLSVSQSIIKTHGGRIQVESKLGHGATFVVELPVTRTVPGAEPPALIEDRPEQPTVDTSILVVDDEPRLLEFVERVLTGQGYEIDKVSRGSDALQRTVENDYDLIILDIRLPDMSGIDVYRQLRRRSRSLARKVMFMTGGFLDPDISRFLARANGHRLTKPFSADRLREEVGQTLGEMRP